ncbi:MAG: DUF2147 domain-containing protein [Rhodoferax sp.]|nr:DUF2147 domain-containing protein [Rhodoferax sp.]
MKKLLLSLLLTSAAALVQAQVTPLGAWHSIDDATNKPKAVIRISTNASGALSGVVEKALNPDPKAEPNCVKCSDDRKDKPKVGMEIIRGGKKADGKDVWEEGKILDPDNGTEYRLRLTPIDAGKKLEVRGYVGTPMLGRTQTWIRVE